MNPAYGWENGAMWLGVCATFVLIGLLGTLAQYFELRDLLNRHHDRVMGFAMRQYRNRAANILPADHNAHRSQCAFRPEGQPDNRGAA